MPKWVTISEATVILGLSERTIQRRIANGTLEDKVDGRKRYVKVATDGDVDVVSVAELTDKDDMIRWLKNELEERNRQINRLQEEIKNNRERSDSIIMKLAEEIEFQRQMYQGIKPERKKDRSFWKLLGRTSDDDN
jgi:5-bromo-4-chloroindolyl phosphate hydrolysis protein